jgi:hypothetical protein
MNFVLVLEVLVEQHLQLFDRGLRNGDQEHVALSALHLEYEDIASRREPAPVALGNGEDKRGLGEA